MVSPVFPAATINRVFTDVSNSALDRQQARGRALLQVKWASSITRPERFTDRRSGSIAERIRERILLDSRFTRRADTAAIANRPIRSVAADIYLANVYMRESIREASLITYARHCTATASTTASPTTLRKRADGNERPRGVKGYALMVTSPSRGLVNVHSFSLSRYYREEREGERVG